MIDNKYHYEGTIYANGKPIPNATIDACKWGSKYEIMVFRGGVEYAVSTVNTVEEAEQIYDDYIRTFTTPPTEPIEKPLTGKYKKLRDDLIIAVEAGKKADYGEDGGTSNFDSPSLVLPYYCEKKVKQAAKEAGTNCFKWSCFKARYVFSPPTNAQGNRRTRIAEVMCKTLEELGYEQPLLYCQMD